MFQFALDAALFKFRQRAPHLAPSLQLPPAIATQTRRGKNSRPQVVNRIPYDFRFKK